MAPLTHLAALLGYTTLISALPNPLTLDYATFRGRSELLGGVDNFLGMPFAVASRLENPRLIGPQDALPGVTDATDYGPACPQHELVSSPFYQGNAQVGQLLGFAETVLLPKILRQDEDCLSINVQVPKGVTNTSGLPVLMWIHGGGFELGSSGSLGSEATALQGVIYQGANIVRRSVQMGQPVIFVSANYRLNFFGTLSSKEITDAGVANLFLKDQDVAFEWVQKYIRQFGGDPSKVTVFGESAGAMSTTTHMVLNNGDVSKKFRAAWVFSGPVPKVLGPERAQPFFDRLMARINCGNAPDKLACAKAAPYESIYSAVQGETNFLSYTATLVPWYPRPDGRYLVDDPAALTAAGKVANIPFVIGNMVDEGTLFSLITQLNVTTNEDIVDFFDQVYFTQTPRPLIEQFVGLYSDDPAQGSPYDTGLNNQIGPKYKKIASMIGDYTFTAGRRTLLNVTSSRQNTWSYQIKQSLPILGQLGLLNPTQLNNLPVLGSFHISDVVLNAFGTIPASVSKNSLHIMSSLIQFANTLDPNTRGLGLPAWPKYDTGRKQQFQFREDGPRIIGDEYRKTQMDFIERNAAQLRA